MTNRPRRTPKTYTFVKYERRWHRLARENPDIIDLDNPGFTSKWDVQVWARDREFYCSENVTIKYR